jgi:hypothetical protein
MTPEQDIQELITRWAQAELDADVSAYPALLAPGFQGVGPVGFVLDRDQWARRHLGDMKNHEFEVTGTQTRFYGDVAVVSGIQRQVTTARGHDTSGSFRLVAVCVPVETGESRPHWRIAHIQLSGPLISPDQMPGFAR